MPDPQDKDIESGEATPLLAKSSQHAHANDDEESAKLPATEALAPPPAAAPPPPPDSEGGGTPSSSNDDKNKKRNESSTSLSSANADSMTRKSTKSGKSSRTRKKKKKKDDASSTRSGKSSKSKKDTKKQKQKKKKEGPQKSICHLVFDSVRYLAILASCMMFAMQIVPLIIVGGESTWLQIAVRCYLAIFCLSFVLTESRIPILRKLLASHNDNWILRGFLYTFIGLIGMEQDLAVKVAEIAAGTTANVFGPDYGTLFATLFMNITTWVMIAVGALYFLLGLLCLQGWYERLEKDHTEKVKAWKREKKREEGFRKQHEDYKRYEKDRREGRGEWYDDLE
eukprot:CAMPEP_0183722746 /NCGR_PEP_ID=MMETSP0737-20130205/14615_1 /TAXON_ID=385413 /ORGANISM="Thalassiosira miniscula, Strain CCMP1093" /LENGTH=339 /DNA_ID=CAMNT_0025952977 /DNA_START=134 /DNA_END=1153 /DNA_ORIENTATION=-